MHLARALGQLGQCQLAMRPDQVRQPAPVQVLQRPAVLWRAPAAHASNNPLSKQHPALTQSATALPLLLPHDRIAASSGCQSWRKQGACSGGAEASGAVAGACITRRQQSSQRPCNSNPAICVRARASPLLLPVFQGYVILIMRAPSNHARDRMQPSVCVAPESPQRLVQGQARRQPGSAG